MTGTDVTEPDGAGAPLSGDADAGGAAERLAVAFARVLRGGGLSVPLGSVLTFGEALGDLGLDDRNAVYWAARATLVRRPEDIPFFDRAFAVFWEQREPGAEPAPDEVLHLTLAVDTDEGDDQQGEAEPAGDDPTLTLRFSATETLRHKDFAAYSRDELRQAQQLMADLRLAGSPRRSRRLVKSKIGRRSGQARRICGARSTPRCGPGASRSASASASRASACAGWCCSSTCPGPWSPTPAPCSASSRPRSLDVNAWRPSPSAPASPA